MKQYFIFGLLLFAPTLSLLANDIDALQGRWTSTKSTENGKRTQTLEFKKNKWTFKIASDTSTRFVAEGEAEVKKLGSFNTLRLHKIKYGSSESDLNEADEERQAVFLFHDGQLYVASNLDQEREDEKPALDAYSKAAEANASQLTGSWNLEMKVADRDFDYTLRISETGGKPAAVLISPRSGEYKAKAVTFENNTLKMEIDREIDSNPVTMVYAGKLEGQTLAGTIVIKNGDNEVASGKWTAKK